MEALTCGTTINGAHCTPKGRVIFLFSATCNAQGDIVLQMHQSIAAIALASLQKFAVFFKTQVADISHQVADHDLQSNLERLRTGSAEVVDKTTDLFIPQMLNLDALGYISFKKGCYTGQEIVARAHYRGAVKRRMHHLQLTAAVLPTLGTEILSPEGKAIGNIVSAATVDDQTIEVLAVLADKSSDSTDIIMAGQNYQVSHLPLPYEIPSGP